MGSGDIHLKPSIIDLFTSFLAECNISVYIRIEPYLVPFNRRLPMFISFLMKGDACLLGLASNVDSNSDLYTSLHWGIRTADAIPSVTRRHRPALEVQVI